MALKLISGRRSARARILIHGPPKVGKTTWACQSEDPVVLSGEDGDPHLDVKRFVFDEKTERCMPVSWDEVITKLAAFRDDPSGKTLVLDGMGAIERLCVDHILAKEKWASISKPGYSKGESILLQEMHKFLYLLGEIRNRGLNIIIVCHSAMAKAPNTESMDDFKRLIPALMSINGGDVSGMFVGWSDAVVFAEFETTVAKTERKTIGVSTGRRILHTRGEAGFVAGCRWGNVDPVLDLSWPKFWGQVLEGHSVERMHQRIVEMAGKHPDQTVREKAVAWLQTPQAQSLDELTWAVDRLRA